MVLKVTTPDLHGDMQLVPPKEIAGHFTLVVEVTTPDFHGNMQLVPPKEIAGHFSC
jgi:hypothetical protein